MVAQPVKLGRVKPAPHHRAMMLRLTDYLPDPLPAAPDSYDSTDGAYYSAYGNLQYGDCTCAALANYFSIAAAREGKSLSFDAEEVIDFYLNLTGGADDGLVEVDVLNRAVQGFPLDGHRKLAAWASVDPRDTDLVRRCTAAFWTTYVGAELPKSAQDAMGGVWDVGNPGDGTPNSWGGHALVAPLYDLEGVTFLTWGARQRATWAWWDRYVSETYVLLDADLAKANKVDFDKLVADMTWLKARE